MQLRDLGSQKTYHVPTEVGQKLVAAGLAEVVPSEARAEQPAHIFDWSTSLGARIDDYQDSPVIRRRCRACGQIDITSSFKGTADAAVFHFGKQECPAAVSAQYQKL